MSNKEWIVQLTVTSTHEYSVVASSEEDAIAQAETMYEDGDQGDLLDYEIDTSDGFAQSYEDEGDDAAEYAEGVQGLNFDGPYRGSYE